VRLLGRGCCLWLAAPGLNRLMLHVLLELWVVFVGVVVVVVGWGVVVC